MDVPITLSFTVETNVELSVQPGDTLPPLPEGAVPEVDFEFDDGKVHTTISWGGDRVKFWSTDYDGTYSDNEHRRVWPEADQEDRELLLEWGNAVHERIDAATYGLMLDASYAPGVPKLLIEYATTSNPEED